MFDCSRLAIGSANFLHSSHARFNRPFVPTQSVNVASMTVLRKDTLRDYEKRLIAKTRKEVKDEIGNRFHRIDGTRARPDPNTEIWRQNYGPIQITVHYKSNVANAISDWVQAAFLE